MPIISIMKKEITGEEYEEEFSESSETTKRKVVVPGEAIGSG